MMISNINREDETVGTSKGEGLWHIAGGVCVSVYVLIKDVSVEIEFVHSNTPRSFNFLKITTLDHRRL
jgi:hypothetical protein